MNSLYYPILIPVAGGILTSFFPQKIREFFVVLVSSVTFILTLSLFPAVSGAPLAMEYFSSAAISLSLRVDFLALIMITLISFLGFLVTIFSLGYMKAHSQLNKYYCLLLLFIGSMIGTVAAGDLFTLFLFWELMTVSAFFLVMFDNRKESISAAIKYFVMSEAGALCMLLSIIAIFYLNGTVNFAALSGLSSEARITHLLLLGFLIGAGVKAGIVPLHTWLPDAHPAAPSPVSALLSGVMIKVGIYLIIRVFWQMFTAVISWQLVLCAVGSLTIIIAVSMALIQHDVKRLLAYHSVSQIGYMLLGIGTGVAVGVAGGLFHLVNHTLFKSLLFLCVGAVIYRMKTRDLSELGGLGRVMPVTFAACVVAALSISGIPPFNGFASKWMVYQGVIQLGTAQAGGAAGLFWPVWLTAAFFGSALTLASFVKLLHSVFLSRSPNTLTNVKEVSLPMKIPMVVLALLCVAFGVFYRVPLKLFVYPALNTPSNVTFGTWDSGLATVLAIVGIILGLVILLAGFLSKKVRVVPTWTGGEVQTNGQMIIPGTHFYKTVSSMNGLKQLYAGQENGYFDLYNQTRKLGLVLIERLRQPHSGILPTYLTWVLGGLLVILFAVSGVQIGWGRLLAAPLLLSAILSLSKLKERKKMKKLKVTFEIEGRFLADRIRLNKENLEESILVAFDEKNPSPLFDDCLDAKIRDIEIKEIA